jgi:hypothetical protein
MASNEIHPYNFPTSQYDDFQRLGHPGRFHKVIACTTGTTTFTGSNFGVGGLIVPTGSIGTASLSLGGDIPLGILGQGGIRIYDFSLRSVKVDSGTVYVLLRNHVVK